MRNDLDFAPLHRSSVGFDRVFNLLNNAQRLQALDSWPPYDIIKTSDDDYRIEMAVAGFLVIVQERNVLVIKGLTAEAKDGEHLHRGIAGRSFERRFELADHVNVEDASLDPASQGTLGIHGQQTVLLPGGICPLGARFACWSKTSPRAPV